MALDDYPVNRIIASKSPIVNLVLGIIKSDKEAVSWVLVNGFPILNSKNEIVEVVINFLDITNRKISEQEISKQLDELHRWHDVTLDRESRVLELKQEVNELLKQADKPVRYKSVLTKE